MFQAPGVKGSTKFTKTIDKENATQVPKGFNQKKVAVLEVKEKKNVPEVKEKVKVMQFNSSIWLI